MLCVPAYLTIRSGNQEKSMLGQRTRFLAFHRYVHNLTDSELKNAYQKVKNKLVADRLFDDNSIFVDNSLIVDVLQHEICVREAYQPEILADIQKSYQKNVSLANDFPEINSKHLIKCIS